MKLPKTTTKSHEKMNVLQIIQGLDIGGNSGGAEKFGVELARALKRNGYEVTICAFYRVYTTMEEEWEQRLNAEGIHTFFLTKWNGYGNVAGFIQGILTLLSQLKGHPPYDIVHSHFQLGTVTALLLKLTKRARTAYRTSHIQHEWEKGKYTWMLNRLFIQYLFPMVLDAEIGVSQAIVDYLATHPGVKISRRQPRLIRNAVSFKQPPKIDPAHLPMIIKATGTFIIGSIGRLETQKGYTFLLDAIPKVLSICPNTEFYIIGEGSLHQELEEKAAKLRISNNVHFTGIRTDIAYLLQELDLFVLPSLWEGFPTVLLESMVCNVPVISTNIPGTRELVIPGQNGWLIPPENSQALADAILEAIGNPELRATFVCRAAKDVQHFTIDNIAEEYHQLYKIQLPISEAQTGFHPSE
jgi:glycosyltransferase involved in cell wall biosynthesis